MKSQHGVALIVALIILVPLTLIAVVVMQGLVAQIGELSSQVVI